MSTSILLKKFWSMSSDRSTLLSAIFVNLLFSSLALCDVGRAEEVLFIPAAQEAITEYYQRHRTYPASWYELKMEFSCEPYRTGDVTLLPIQENVSSWRPKGCKCTYLLDEKGNVTKRDNKSKQLGRPIE